MLIRVCLLVFTLVAVSLGAAPEKVPVAVLIADWFPHSHPDVIVRRILEGYTLKPGGKPASIRVASIFRDLPSERDISPKMAETYGFPIVDSVDQALTLGGDTLAVDGVILCTEWADYPKSPTGQIQFPHRALFAACVETMTRCGKVVPVFIDKHLADNWEDSIWIYETAKKHGIPLMAGSSVPMSWRQPPLDVTKAKPLKEIVGVSYHTLDTYGFHGLEMVQALAEQRQGWETGIVAVQCLTGEAVWEAADKLYSLDLLEAAIARQERPLPPDGNWRSLVREPVLFVMDYKDGLRVSLLTLNGWVRQWSSAWRYADGRTASTLFWLDEKSGTYMHFANQLAGIEQMFLTGKPAWPVERTLMTSGILNACLQSKELKAGARLTTPWLTFGYEALWHWAPPPPFETAYQAD